MLTLRHILFVLITIFIITFLLYVFFSKSSHWNGLNDDNDHSSTNKILNRFYFVTTTLTSVGYGDISPKSNSCKIFVALTHMILLFELLNIII